MARSKKVTVVTPEPVAEVTHRNIKRSEEERNQKIFLYLRAACYNASKTGVTQKYFAENLKSLFTQYGIAAK